MTVDLSIFFIFSICFSSIYFYLLFIFIISDNGRLKGSGVKEVVGGVGAQENWYRQPSFFF